jgi:hypothetical protein
MCMLSALPFLFGHRPNGFGVLRAASVALRPRKRVSYRNSQGRVKNVVFMV